MGKQRRSATIVFLITLSLLTALTSGCAEVRMGYFSRPYLANTKAPRETAHIIPYENTPQFDMQKITLPGINLDIDLKNDTQTSDTLWFGIEIPMIPVPLDLRSKRRYIPSGETLNRYFIDIDFMPLIEGIKINPYKIKLVNNGQKQELDIIKEIHYHDNEKGGTEKLETVMPDTEITLSKGVSRIIYLYYFGAHPMPDDDIELDMRDAMRHPKGAEIPLIMFKKTRYVDGKS